MKTFTRPEKKAAQILQDDMPLTEKPFAAVADACGLTGDDLLAWIQDLSQKGIIRKIGAILRHQKAGYGTNVLVMWSVSPDAIENAGRTLANLPYISHCYERHPAFQNKFNLFTMLHAQHDDISPLLDAMSQLISCNDFLLLESLHEYKKTSPEYF